MTSIPRKILLSVTASESLKLMNGLPEFLASRGWEVVVVTSWEDREAPISNSTVKFLNLKMSRKPSPLQDIVALFRWLIVIFKESPHVVFCGTPKAGMLGILAAWLNQTPVRIYHLRGLRLETSTGISKKIYRAIEQMVISLSTDTLCVSPSLKSVIISERLGSENKLTVLGKGSSNGIDINEFGNTKRWSYQASELSKKLGINPDLPTIGFVGRLTADKGIFDLISAHKTLIEHKLPNQLLLVGKTEDALEAAKIEELIADDPLIFQTGLMQHPQIAFLLMNIFCLPTYREGFPNVVLEAGMNLLPTVTTSATGSRDSVIPEKTGIIYKTGDVEALVSSLSTLIHNPSLARKYGENAFKFVTKEFDRAVIWEQIETFISIKLASELSRKL